MSRMGLVLDTLKIQNVTDEVNYLQSIGRIRGAALNQKQAVAEAEARADAAVQQASNWAASEVAKLDADIQVAKQETAKRIADARSRREAMIQESRGEVVAQVALVKAEIEKQRARAAGKAQAGRGCRAARVGQAASGRGGGKREGGDDHRARTC